MAPAAEPAPTDKTTVTINVDGHDVEAYPDELLIAAAERHGTYIPRFCYHSRMKPVGMCRMCLVNVEGPRGTSIQPACMLTVNEGMRVDTQAPDVKKAQDGVLEFLLANHPLDCPVCDKGGECPLQDQTLAFGPGETRFIEEKRHFEKPINISDLVALDRERCILCDRCTRFADDVAGDPLIHFQNRGNGMQVNVFPDHPFASYFSGNTVQICPVGALTAIPYRFKARPWDLEQVESTCTSCSFGCRVAVQSSGNEVTRYLGLDAEPTNHGWMCDKGRFDFTSLRSDARLEAPLMKKNGGERYAGRKNAGEAATEDAAGRRAGVQVEVSWGEALSATADAIRIAGPSKVAVIGGSRLANEDQYAWAKLAKSVIGTDNVDAQVGDGLPAEVVLGVPRATIDQTCNAKVVVLLGPDLKEELPVLFLRLREAVIDKKLEIIEVALQWTSFSPYATHHLAYRTGDASAVVAGLLGKVKGSAGGLEPEQIQAASKLLEQHANDDIVVVFGRQSVAESDQAISDAVGLFAEHTNAKFLPALRRSNVLGALDMGLAPGVLPGRISLEEGREWFTEAWGSVPASRGLDTTSILKAAAGGDIDVIILLGSDPLFDFPDRGLVREAFDRVELIVSVDIFDNASVREADVVLPAAAYTERGGTTTNIEGRITRLGQKVTPPGVAWPDWMIANELAERLGSDLELDTLDAIWNEIELFAPSHRGITTHMLATREHRDGVVAGEPFGTGHADSALVDTAGTLDQTADRSPIARGLTVPAPIVHRVTRAATLPPVDGYGARLLSTRKLYDLGSHVRNSPHLANLVAKSALRIHPVTLSPLGVPSGSKVRIRTAKGSLEVEVEVDESVPKGVVALPFNVTGEGAADLIDFSVAVTNVRLDTP